MFSAILRNPVALQNLQHWIKGQGDLEGNQHWIWGTGEIATIEERQVKINIGLIRMRLAEYTSTPQQSNDKWILFDILASNEERARDRLQWLNFQGITKNELWVRGKLVERQLFRSYQLELFMMAQLRCSGARTLATFLYVGVGRFPATLFPGRGGALPSWNTFGGCRHTTFSEGARSRRDQRARKSGLMLPFCLSCHCHS